MPLRLYEWTLRGRWKRTAVEAYETGLLGKNRRAKTSGLHAAVDVRVRDIGHTTAGGEIIVRKRKRTNLDMSGSCTVMMNSTGYLEWDQYLPSGCAETYTESMKKSSGQALYVKLMLRPSGHGAGTGVES